MFVRRRLLTDFGCGADHDDRPLRESFADAQSAGVLVDIPVSRRRHSPFAGPSMLRRAITFSGGGVHPLEWGLGLYGTQSTRERQDVIKLMQEFRDRKIPCDVISSKAGW